LDIRFVMIPLPRQIRRTKTEKRLVFFPWVTGFQSCHAHAAL
jgi:hypothetical protein